MAKVATIAPWSNALCKLPVREKCWNAKYAAITKDIIAPSCVPLPVTKMRKSQNSETYKLKVSQTIHLPYVHDLIRSHNYEK